MKVFEDPITGRAIREDGEPAVTCPGCGNHYVDIPALAVHACEATFIAHFTPQAWIRDYATEIDAYGPQEWDCTRAVFADPRYFLGKLSCHSSDSWTDYPGVLDNDDMLKDDPDAPEWVRLHRGPFDIHIRVAEPSERINSA